MPAGFEADGVLTFAVALPQTRYPGPLQRRLSWYPFICPASAVWKTGASGAAIALQIGRT